MPRASAGRADLGGGGAIGRTTATRAAATTDFVSADLTTDGLAYAAVTLDMTSVGTGSVSLFVEGKDNASGKYFTIASYPNIITNATKTVIIGPGLSMTATTDVSYFNGFLTPLWRIRVVANNANATTYTVGHSLVW